VVCLYGPPKRQEYVTAAALPAHFICPAMDLIQLRRQRIPFDAWARSLVTSFPLPRPALSRCGRAAFHYD
jgi:hypothetical protein